MTKSKIQNPNQSSNPNHLIFKYLSFKYSFVIGILSFVILVSSSPAEVIDKIAVVVNDQAITESETEQAMKPVSEQLRKTYSGKVLEEKLKQARKDVIERLIEEKLIIQEARSQKIEVGNVEIEERIKQVRSKFPDEQSFQKAIKVQGVNIWELRKTYKEQIMVRKIVRHYVRAHTDITPRHILEYYQKHINDFRQPGAVRLSQILIKYKPNEESLRTEKAATQVMELLAVGADFASVARKYSNGPNAQNGGDMGMVEQGAMSKEIDDVIFNMKEGEVSRPIKTNTGFVIVKVNSIRKEQAQPIEEVKDKIEELLLDENAKLILDKWVGELKEKALISIKE